MPTAKSLTIQPVNYENVVEKINLVIQKTLEKKLHQKITWYHIKQQIHVNFQVNLKMN